jgi:hypothetical protein
MQFPFYDLLWIFKNFSSYHNLSGTCHYHALLFYCVDKKRYSAGGEDMFPSITTANLMSSYLNTAKKEVNIGISKKSRKH